VNVICPAFDLDEDITKQEISIMAIVTVRITHYSWMDQTRMDVHAVQSDGAPY